MNSVFLANNKPGDTFSSFVKAARGQYNVPEPPRSRSEWGCSPFFSAQVPSLGSLHSLGYVPLGPGTPWWEGKQKHGIEFRLCFTEAAKVTHKVPLCVNHIQHIRVLSYVACRAT